jgi:hypothetical protein
MGLGMICPTCLEEASIPHALEICQHNLRLQGAELMKVAALQVVEVIAVRNRERHIDPKTVVIV